MVQESSEEDVTQVYGIRCKVEDDKIQDWTMILLPILHLFINKDVHYSMIFKKMVWLFRSSSLKLSVMCQY